jgi:hypothetical protein
MNTSAKRAAALILGSALMIGAMAGIAAEKRGMDAPRKSAGGPPKEDCDTYDCKYKDEKAPTSSRSLDKPKQKGAKPKKEGCSTVDCD